MGDTSPVFPTKLSPCNPLSWLWSRLQTTLAQIARIGPKWMYIVLNILSPFTSFEQLALALKKQSCPELFLLYGIYFLHSEFLTTCACPENRVSPEISHCIEYIFHHSGFLSNFVLSLKNRGCPEFTVLIIYFLSFRIFEQLALALKNKVALIFSLH